MNKKDQLLEKVQIIQSSEGDSFTYNETDLLNELASQQENQSSLAIKILSIFGGFLATMAFLGFLLIAGLYDSEIGLVIFGLGFIILGILITKSQGKLILDTLSVSLFITGFGLLAFGLSGINFTENNIIFIILILNVISLFVSRNYLLSFIAVIFINGSLLALIDSNNLANLIHLYIALNVALLVYLMLNEAKLICQYKKLSRLYNPFRIGIMFSLFAGLITLSSNGFSSITSNYIWISSLVFMVAILFLVSKIIPLFKIETSKNNFLILSITAFILLPTVLSPSISGALLILLLSFYVNYKTGIALGVISFIYFIAQYYYDLNFTLLTKSIILFSSGILFIAFYLIINKKLLQNEKN